MAEKTGEFHTNSTLLDFDNTEIAFKGKTDAELKASYRLFKLMSNSTLAKIGPSITQSALKIGLPVSALIKRTLFKQFCGGETIEECETTIEALAKAYVGTILDYSVEGALNSNAYTHTAEEVVRTITRAKDDPRVPFAVFKPSGVARFKLLEKVSLGKILDNAEQVEWFKVKGRVNHICKTAYDMDVPLMIDADESWIQPAVDNLALEMMRMYNRDKAIVYNTYQLYREGMLSSLQSHYYRSQSEGFIMGAKLVRGAYMDKERARAARLNYPSPIQENKDTTDKAYNDALEFCLENINDLAIVAGTHNEASCMILTELMKKQQLPEDHPHIYFAQLLGMSDNLSFNLSYFGYNVVKYVPYGPVKQVLPYLFRRAEENTAIAGHMGRELSLLAAERKRRGI
ncbi:proline dehydrogenase family protein [Desertivirga xinjiangensis]|uniref:proline dehydrogenase family protein n=1 Tax=Desertivirga xinjiangensis TaxID=539206 RepID=UPI00210D8E82|nr:proline dehydrogenase family protein [Pedobacter xinjiangensis]